MQGRLKINRQKRVLEIIIKYHTSTAEAVSSRLISKDMRFSSATIRNIMFELEELGLIWQPHISSGRIPTDKGYRVYVDSLMKVKNFLEISDEYTDNMIPYLRAHSLEDIILKGLQLCCRLTSQTCIALFPTLKIKEHLLGKIEEGVEDILTSLYDFEDRLYLDGTHYLAEQPEFKDTEKISSVLKILEDKKGLKEILEDDLKDSGIKVHIGDENRAVGFNKCSLITANYSLEDDIAGTLGIIGPMRMEYRRIIPTINHITESIKKAFSEIV